MVILKKQIISFLLAIVMIIPLCTSVFADEEFEIDAEAYILINPESNEDIVIVEKNADKIMHPASTTKIMTALLALEKGKLDMDMKASNEALVLDADYTRAGIRAGEILPLEALLNAMLISSANEAANIIAENLSPNGRISGFVELMNQKALDLGLTNTHFDNPYGFDNEEHYISARDLSIIAKEAMEHDEFKDIVSKKEYQLPDTNYRSSENWTKLTSTNRLLGTESKYYSRVTGIKTGYTDLAGCNLVSTAIDRNGTELISIVLGANDYNTLFAESKKLLEYGFKNYKYQDIIKKGSTVSKDEVIDAKDEEKVELITDQTLTYYLPVNEKDWNIERNKIMITELKAPIEKNQIMGYYEYYSDDLLIGKVNIIANNSIEKSLNAQIRDKFNEIINNKKYQNIAKIILAIIIGFIILRITLKRVSRNRNNKRKKNTRNNNYRINRYM